MTLDNRIIWSDNGTLKDLSHELNDPNEATVTIDFNSAQDYLFIGSTLNFNHRYFHVSTVNSNAANISIDAWDGNEWVAVVDLLDNTKLSLGSVPLARSGYVSWTVDKSEFWDRDDTDDMDSSGLQTLKIFNLYWIRIKWSSNLSGTTAINFIGYKFADDIDLAQRYPYLNTTTAKTRFNNGVAGKTTWDEQHFASVEDIVRDLRSKHDSVFFSRNQILRWDYFKDAAIYKCAEIIFNAFGDDKKDDRDNAKVRFSESMALALDSLDRDNDARLDPDERFRGSTIIRR